MQIIKKDVLNLILNAYSLLNQQSSYKYANMCIVYNFQKSLKGTH